ncbi:MAG: GNAT family N-acetyltransferase, partial [Prevotella denticola]
MITISCGGNENLILSRLWEENRSKCEWLKTHAPQEGMTVNFFDCDDDLLIGGAVGSVANNWYSLELLHVLPEYRNHRIATQLMERIESYAEENGLRGIRVETWDFQARGFYERLGFRVYGELDDCPPGTTLYCLKKMAICVTSISSR